MWGRPKEVTRATAGKFDTADAMEAEVRAELKALSYRLMEKWRTQYPATTPAEERARLGDIVYALTTGVAMLMAGTIAGAATTLGKDPQKLLEHCIDMQKGLLDMMMKGARDEG